LGSIKTGCPDVPSRIDFQAVRDPPLRGVGQIEEHAPVGYGTVGRRVVAHPEALPVIGVRNVQDFLIGREREAVGTVEILDDGLQLAAFVLEDAIEVQFLGLVGVPFRAAVGRVG